LKNVNYSKISVYDILFPNLTSAFLLFFFCISYTQVRQGQRGKGKISRKEGLQERKGGIGGKKVLMEMND